jgi:prophage regulatory protein
MTKPPRRIYRWKTVIEMTELSRHTIYRWMENGTFPQKKPLSADGRAVGWDSAVIDAWIRRSRGKKNDNVTK